MTTGCPVTVSVVISVPEMVLPSVNSLMFTFFSVFVSAEMARLVKAINVANVGIIFIR